MKQLEKIFIKPISKERKFVYEWLVENGFLDTYEFIEEIGEFTGGKNIFQQE